MKTNLIKNKKKLLKMLTFWRIPYIFNIKWTNKFKFISFPCFSWIFRQN